MILEENLLQKIVIALILYFILGKQLKSTNTLMALSADLERLLHIKMAKKNLAGYTFSVGVLIDTIRIINSSKLIPPQKSTHMLTYCK